MTPTASSAAYTGEGTKTVITSEARCKVSFRLVGEQDPAAVGRAFEAHVRKRVPADCSVEIIAHKGSRAIALPYDMPAVATRPYCSRRRVGARASGHRHGGLDPDRG